MAWVDPQCNCAVEMAHTISLQQVAQVDAPSTFIKAFFLADFIEIKKQMFPIFLMQEPSRHTKHHNPNCIVDGDVSVAIPV